MMMIHILQKRRNSVHWIDSIDSILNGLYSSRHIFCVQCVVCVTKLDAFNSSEAEITVNRCIGIIIYSHSPHIHLLSWLCNNEQIRNLKCFSSKLVFFHWPNFVYVPFPIVIVLQNSVAHSANIFTLQMIIG